MTKVWIIPGKGRLQMRNEENEGVSNSKGMWKNQKIKGLVSHPLVSAGPPGKMANVSKPPFPWLFEFSIKWEKWEIDVDDIYIYNVDDIYIYMWMTSHWMTVRMNWAGVRGSHTDAMISHHPCHCDMRSQHTMSCVTSHLSSSNSMMLHNQVPSFIPSPENLTPQFLTEMSTYPLAKLYRYTKDSPWGHDILAFKLSQRLDWLSCKDPQGAYNCLIS